MHSVRPKGCAAPIHYRLYTSDINVLAQIFLSGEYVCVGSEVEPKFIVDCGANIGCASVYFLNRYPNASVIAIEPDSGNFEVCQLNIAPYGARIRALHCAVWPRCEGLTFDRGVNGDAGEWGFRARACRQDERPEIDGMSLTSIVEKSPNGWIDLLKIDIEGGETELFATDFDPWLSRTKTIVIELHGKLCRDVFHRTVGLYPFRIEDFGSVTVARRQDLAPLN
jgi:FkbM family methyltransferase